MIKYKVSLYGLRFMDFKKLTQLKDQLDALRHFNQAILKNLEEWIDVELIYSSNAIEGNTLTRQETAVLLEKGLTVSGKPLKDHLEAVNHRNALIFMRTMVNKKGFSLEDVLSIHKLILKGIDDTNAGTMRSVPVRISGSAVVLPNHLKVQGLMDKFIQDTHASSIHPVMRAALIHYEFVSIHPFIDGNGRTARLLMNLALMQEGYPPAIIQPKDRLSYIKGLEKAQLGGTLEDYLGVIEKAVFKSLMIYFKALSGESTHNKIEDNGTLLKIGVLAERTKETVPTLRYWTKMGLLNVDTTTPSGYQLYHPCQIERCWKIRSLQKKRYTLEEIISLLDS